MVPSRQVSFRLGQTNGKTGGRLEWSLYLGLPLAEGGTDSGTFLRPVPPG